MAIFGDDNDDFFLFDVVHPINSQVSYCPLCNKRLTIKNIVNNNQFLGCDYPTCQFTCDVSTSQIHGLTSQEHLVVSMGGTNVFISNKRSTAEKRIEAKQARRVQAGQSVYKTGGVVFPDRRPTSEIDTLRKRIDELEATVKELQDWIKIEKDRREKFSIDL